MFWKFFSWSFKKYLKESPYISAGNSVPFFDQTTQRNEIKQWKITACCSGQVSECLCVCKWAFYSAIVLLPWIFTEGQDSIQGLIKLCLPCCCICNFFKKNCKSIWRTKSNRSTIFQFLSSARGKGTTETKGLGR